MAKPPAAPPPFGYHMDAALWGSGSMLESRLDLLIFTHVITAERHSSTEEARKVEDYCEGLDVLHIYVVNQDRNEDRA